MASLIRAGDKFALGVTVEIPWFDYLIHGPLPNPLSPKLNLQCKWKCQLPPINLYGFAAGKNIRRKRTGRKEKKRKKRGRKWKDGDLRTKRKTGVRHR